MASTTIRIMAGRGCITKSKQTILKDGRRTDESRVIERCHSHYSEVVEEILNENKASLYKELSSFYENEDNYGKDLVINIEFSASLS